MSDDAPIRLEEAARRYGLTVWTLRAERDRGYLKTYKIGRTEYTTLAYLKEMEEEKCRVGRQARGSGSTRGEAPGLSETERASSARAAAWMTAQELKNILHPTSVKNIRRRLVTTR